MIYATIPSKYLFVDDLTEILRNLKTLYLILDKVKKCRDILSEDILECNSGDAIAIGKDINKFSTNIKHITYNATTITRVICQVEQITLEECGLKMEELPVNFTLANPEDLFNLPNKISQDLMQSISKKYPQCKFFHTICNVDGTCTNF